MKICRKLIPDTAIEFVINGNFRDRKKDDIVFIKGGTLELRQVDSEAGNLIYIFQQEIFDRVKQATTISQSERIIYDDGRDVLILLTKEKTPTKVTFLTVEDDIFTIKYIYEINEFTRCPMNIMISPDQEYILLYNNSNYIYCLELVQKHTIYFEETIIERKKIKSNSPDKALSISFFPKTNETLQYFAAMSRGIILYGYSLDIYYIESGKNNISYCFSMTFTNAIVEKIWTYDMGRPLEIICLPDHFGLFMIGHNGFILFDFSILKSKIENEREYPVVFINDISATIASPIDKIYVVYKKYFEVSITTSPFSLSESKFQIEEEARNRILKISKIGGSSSSSDHGFVDNISSMCLARTICNIEENLKKKGNLNSKQYILYINTKEGYIQANRIIIPQKEDDISLKHNIYDTYIIQAQRTFEKLFALNCGGIFACSRNADHILYRPILVTDSFYLHCPRVSFEIRQKFNNNSPLHDFLSVENKDNETGRSLWLACGEAQSGCLKHISIGLDLSEILSSPSFFGVSRIWTLKNNFNDEAEDIIVMSFTEATRALHKKGNVFCDVTDEIGLMADQHTIACGLISNNYIAQVTPKCVALCTLEALHTEKKTNKIPNIYENVTSINTNKKLGKENQKLIHHQRSNSTPAVTLKYYYSYPVHIWRPSRTESKGKFFNYYEEIEDEEIEEASCKITIGAVTENFITVFCEETRQVIGLVLSETPKEETVQDLMCKRNHSEKHLEVMASKYFEGRSPRASSIAVCKISEKEWIFILASYESDIFVYKTTVKKNECAFEEIIHLDKNSLGKIENKRSEKLKTLYDCEDNLVAETILIIKLEIESHMMAMKKDKVYKIWIGFRDGQIGEYFLDLNENEMKNFTFQKIGTHPVSIFYIIPGIPGIIGVISNRSWLFKYNTKSGIRKEIVQLNLPSNVTSCAPMILKKSEFEIKNQSNLYEQPNLFAKYYYENNKNTIVFLLVDDEGTFKINHIIKKIKTIKLNVTPNKLSLLPGSQKMIVSFTDNVTQSEIISGIKIIDTTTGKIEARHDITGFSVKTFLLWPPPDYLKSDKMENIILKLKNGNNDVEMVCGNSQDKSRLNLRRRMVSGGMGGNQMIPGNKHNYSRKHFLLMNEATVTYENLNSSVRRNYRSNSDMIPDSFNSELEAENYEHNIILGLNRRLSEESEIDTKVRGYLVWLKLKYRLEGSSEIRYITWEIYEIFKKKMFYEVKCMNIYDEKTIIVSMGHYIASYNAKESTLLKKNWISTHDVTTSMISCHGMIAGADFQNSITIYNYDDTSHLDENKIDFEIVCEDYISRPIVDLAPEHSSGRFMAIDENGCIYGFENHVASDEGCQRSTKINCFFNSKEDLNLIREIQSQNHSIDYHNDETIHVCHLISTKSGGILILTKIIEEIKENIKKIEKIKEIKSLTGEIIEEERGTFKYRLSREDHGNSEERKILDGDYFKSVFSKYLEDDDLNVNVIRQAIVNTESWLI